MSEELVTTEPELPADDLPWKPEPVRIDPKTLPLDEALETIQGIEWLARVIMASGDFPEARDVAGVILKLIAARDFGIPALRAMKSLYIIKGNPSMSADLCSALVKRSGKYDFRIVRSDGEACELEWFQLVDGSWDSLGVTGYTMPEAVKAGFTTGKNSHSWKAFPADMLFARAVTRGQRRHASDVGYGAIYTPDEIGAGAGPEQYADDGIAFGEDGGSG
jgi:hypothetical protein